MVEFGRRKPAEVLAGQLAAAEEKIGEKLLPPSGLEAALGLDLTKLKTYFPLRYELCYDLYLKCLRGEPLDESDQAELALIKKTLGALNNLDRYIGDHRAAGLQDRTLRPRQFNVFEDLRDFLEEGGTKGYVKLPTGVGKTVIFIEFIEALKLKSLIVVPTNVLVEQTKERIGEFAGKDIDVGQINRSAKAIGQDVTIITYDSLLRGVTGGTLDPKQFDCVIFDEAHEALGPKMSELLRGPAFDQAIQIGFTATPKYTKRKQVSAILPEEVHSMSIQEAVEEGLLAGFRVIVAKTDADLRNVRITATGQYSEKDLDKAINTERRNLAAVKLYKEMFSGQKVVLYCNSVNHAQNVARLFRAEDFPVEAVWGDQAQTTAGAKEQRESLRKLRRADIVGVANARMLIVGWDDPSVKVCFNLTPTQSLVDAEQRGGRVLRLFGDERATIVDFIDNLDADKFPVSFVEVANAAGIPPPDKSERTGAGSLPGAAKPGIKIEGLEIITDQVEVLRMVREKTDQKYNLPPADWLSLEAIAVVVGRKRSSLLRWMNMYLTFKDSDSKWGSVYDLELEADEYGRFCPPDSGALEWYFKPGVEKKIKAAAEKIWATSHRYKEVTPPPSDWIDLTKLKAEIPDFLSKFQILQNKFSRQYEKFNTADNRRERMFVSPRLAEALRKAPSKKEFAASVIPSGEQNLKQLRDQLAGWAGAEETERIMQHVNAWLGDFYHLFNFEVTPQEVTVTAYSGQITNPKIARISKTTARQLNKAAFAAAQAAYEALSPAERAVQKPPAFGDFMQDSAVLKLEKLKQ